MGAGASAETPQQARAFLHHAARETAAADVGNLLGWSEDTHNRTPNESGGFQLLDGLLRIRDHIGVLEDRISEEAQQDTQSEANASASASVPRTAPVGAVTRDSGGGEEKSSTSSLRRRGSLQPPLVRGIESGVDIPTPLASDDESLGLHWGVTCDGCGQNPLRGLRFKCSVCDDYDLCRNCYRNRESIEGHPPEHNFRWVSHATPSGTIRRRFAERRMEEEMRDGVGPVLAPANTSPLPTVEEVESVLRELRSLQDALSARSDVLHRALVGELMGRNANGPRPAPVHAIKELPKVPSGSKIFSDQAQCAICLCDFGDVCDTKTDNSVSKLPCSHIYHTGCISSWLQKNGSCPVCRQKIVPTPGRRASAERQPEVSSAAVPQPAGDSVIARIMTVTGADRGTAVFALQSAAGNPDAAVNLILAS